MAPGTVTLDSPSQPKGVADRESPDPVPGANIPGADICGVRINIISRAGLLDAVAERVRLGEPAYIVTPNVDHVCLCHRNPEFKRAYEGAFLSVPDGVPLLWGSRLLGTPLVERLNGTDLVYDISERAAADGLSVFFLGAEEGVAVQTADRLKARYPGLLVAGVLSPPMGFEKSEEENARIVEMLRVVRPDICFFAVGSPKQEIWMREFSARTGTPVMIGVGASFDFIAGRKRRAPRVFQKMGLEWFWRLCTEPKRLWRRYLVNDMLYFKLLLRQVFSKPRPAAAPEACPGTSSETPGDRT